MRCDGSLLLPLHLAIMGNDFLMMFLLAVTWTRAVGLRGHGLNILGLKILKKNYFLEVSKILFKTLINNKKI